MLHSSPTISAAKLQQAFLSILPRIELHARICFRDVYCLNQRADSIAEAVALTWAWFVRLVKRGKNPTGFVSVLALYAASHVRSGRRLCGQEPAKDVLSPLAQRQNGFTVGSLRENSTLGGNMFDEALQDNTQTPPDQQAQFRIDFPHWRNSRCERDRRVVDDLMLGERTSDVARRHRLSRARISQLRREFHDDWFRFCGEAE